MRTLLKSHQLVNPDEQSAVLAPAVESGVAQSQWPTEQSDPIARSGGFVRVFSYWVQVYAMRCRLPASLYTNPAKLKKSVQK